MIRAENLSYSFPQKELYKNVSFTIEDGAHCAFIGTNGTGKSTLADMILHADDYLYSGKLTVGVTGRIGYVSQFYSSDEKQNATVFSYLSGEFVRLQNKINDICNQMAGGGDADALMERYQTAMDEFQAIDGDFYESNISKQLKTAGLKGYEDRLLDSLSGGEFKLVQAIREMMQSPQLVIMDEPDVFLDFVHLNGLRGLINSYRGTMLVITHNRYLLNHCFNKILHLENAQIQEFDGSYIEYNFLLLQMKVKQQELASADMEEVERNRRLVERLRKEATAVDSAARGRNLHARVSLLERLETRKTEYPFVDIPKPEITLGTFRPEDGAVGDGETEALSVEDYGVAFERRILEHVTFSMKAGEKAAVVGSNGTGKTTLLRDIFKNENPAIRVDEKVRTAYLSQMHGEVFDERGTVRENFADAGFETERQLAEYLKGYGFDAELLSARVENLSGGEKNLLQLAKISLGDAGLLLLDEPTSHLDIYAQTAFEEALAAYPGTALIVSHDFYTVANCADYVFLVEGKTLRKLSIRAFRKMVYAKYFDKDYLELEQRKKELESRVSLALKAGKFEEAGKYCERLGEVVGEIVSA